MSIALQNLLIAISVVIVLLLSGYDLYIYKKQIAELSRQKDDLQLKYARQNCNGEWKNNACIPFKTTLIVSPPSGSSPLTVHFEAQVPDMNYAIDYGDGSSSWLSGGYNSQSAGDCTPDSSGLCTVTLTHKYVSGFAASFKAHLMKNGRPSATVTINTTP